MELKKLPRVGSAFFTSGSGVTGSSTGSATGSGMGATTAFCLGTARFTGATLAGVLLGVFFVVAIQHPITYLAWSQACQRFGAGCL